MVFHFFLPPTFLAGTPVSRIAIFETSATSTDWESVECFERNLMVCQQRKKCIRRWWWTSSMFMFTWILSLTPAMRYSVRREWESRRVQSNDTIPFDDNPSDNLLLIRKLAEFCSIFSRFVELENLANGCRRMCSMSPFFLWYLQVLANWANFFLVTLSSISFFCHRKYIIFCNILINPIIHDFRYFWCSNSPSTAYRRRETK